ncbi:hypothetical protein K0T92_10685 [Paenibacillus oenotherae]|uniref:Uncharacterized protein n=2 Tax=Paenibacillus oenotherae TaxID=1435645 RepID=A0ABS7D5K1_9BACL|nr:hypothetical protein [Paenibacillus oenotherae]
MNSAGKFLLTLFAWMLFAWGGYSFLKNENLQNDYVQASEQKHISSSKYEGTADLNEMTGEQLIGMIPHALAGEYRLSIDYIGIDSSTDISSINLRGVVGLKYKISVNRTNGAITDIYATHE